MQTRHLRELEVFLGEQGLDLDHRAFELELNSHGWRVAAERSTRQGVQLEIECLVERDEHVPRFLKIVSDLGYHDRDVALMWALQRVRDYGFLRSATTSPDA